MNRAIVNGFALSAISFALSLGVIVAGSKLYANWLNIRDPTFRYENQLEMWDPEPTLGFVNKPNFSGISFGNIQVQTNDRGFRGTRPLSVAKVNGIVRIVGLGDSVMWGTAVAQENSILGFLEKWDHSSSYQFINAAVVGYSTYQQLLYFENYILPLKPDIVLVNYCDNDLLPTEDPFGNIRGIYVRYLNKLLERQDITLAVEDKSNLKELIRIVNSAERVWDAMKELRVKSQDRLSFAEKVFVSMPLARMAELSREAGIRLIYLFIPPQKNQSLYARNTEALKNLLAQKGAAFLDVQPALVPGEIEVMRKGRSLPRWVWPQELKAILQLRNLRAVHRSDKFIDRVHPTEKGNAIIADHLWRYLTQSAS